MDLHDVVFIILQASKFQLSILLTLKPFLHIALSRSGIQDVINHTFSNAVMTSSRSLVLGCVILLPHGIYKLSYE